MPYTKKCDSCNTPLMFGRPREDAEPTWLELVDDADGRRWVVHRCNPLAAFPPMYESDWKLMAAGGAMAPRRRRQPRPTPSVGPPPARKVIPLA